MRYTRFIIAVGVLLNSTALYSTIPSSFIIRGHQNADQYEWVSQAVLKADLEIFRYADRRTVLKFENGVELELFSANELVANGVKVADVSYKKADTPGFQSPILVIQSDGTISALFQKESNKSKSALHLDK